MPINFHASKLSPTTCSYFGIDVRCWSWLPSRCSGSNLAKMLEVLCFLWLSRPRCDVVILLIYLKSWQKILTAYCWVGSQHQGLSLSPATIIFADFLVGICHREKDNIILCFLLHLFYLPLQQLITPQWCFPRIFTMTEWRQLRGCSLSPRLPL